MTDRVAAMAATFSAQPSSTNKSIPSQESSRLGFSRSNAILKKTSLYLALDLLEYTSRRDERPLKEIRQHFQILIKAVNRTKEINIQTMSRDNRKDHCYFIFATL